tara:strand:+ start:366 stop:656 length:291 start_codon:yes stop_codon:yes gene_type:complete
MKNKNKFAEDLIRKIQPGVFVPVQVIESLIEVIDYLYEDELEHYMENVKTKGEKDNHIFPKLVTMLTFIEHLNNGSPSLEQHFVEVSSYPLFGGEE